MILAAAFASLGLAAAEAPSIEGTACAVELVVLGAGQDAGAPQIGVADDPAWSDPSRRLTATAIGLVEAATGARFLFEAAPEIKDHLNALGAVTAQGERNSLSGVFVTHAHIGHYAGLMFLGREAAGADRVTVFAPPRMKRFLETNGPWDQLVHLQNISLREIAPAMPARIGESLSVEATLVPHRDEYSETVAFRIRSDDAMALFVPDIDDWEQWRETEGVDLAELVHEASVAFLDATFFEDGELAGRDMSQIPHPRVVETMARLAHLSAADRRKVRFIHYNHTNPIRDPDSPASRAVEAAGFGVARAGDRHCLSASEH